MIGETEEEYDAGLCADVCKLQLAKDLAGVSAAAMKDVVIAYEPVWAIGTGLTRAAVRKARADASRRRRGVQPTQSRGESVLGRLVEESAQMTRFSPR